MNSDKALHITEDIFIQSAIAKNKAIAAELDKRCKEVAGSVDSQKLATLNDVTYQYIREMLNTNGEQRPWQLKMLPSLIQAAPEKFVDVILFWFCDLCGYNPPEKKKELTTEEELKLLKSKIKEMQLDEHPKFKNFM
jgi:hypothetical protein